MTAQSLAVFAEKPVAQGDTWSRDAAMEIPTLGSMKTVVKYRYDGTENRDGKELDKITATTQMAVVPPKDKSIRVQVNVVDQKTEATIYFDGDAGQVVEVKTTSKMKIDDPSFGIFPQLETTFTQTLRRTP